MIITADKVVYKLNPKVEILETGTKDSSDPTVPEKPPVSPTTRVQKPTSPPPPPPRTEVGPNRGAH